MTFQDLIAEEEYAKMRGVSIRTIQRERAMRTGAPFIKLGKKIYYRPAAIEQWLIAQEQTPVRSGLAG